MKLNEAQSKAVSHVDGPMMVIAGPGSGKTTVITKRIKYLIESAGVSPADILVITFTRAAAGEMQQRFRAMTPGKEYPVRFGTFHSIFYWILKTAYGQSMLRVISEEEKRGIIEQILHTMELSYENKEEIVSSIVSQVSLVKCDMMDVENYYSKDMPEHAFRELYRRLDAELKRRKLIDFDDMLVYTYELLSQRKDILAAWQNRFRYFLVDEFQDVNRIQYDILRLLAGERQNLFVVGDDDQSIYRFRGARPEIMLNFKKDYPEAETVTLAENYRSVENIIRAAGKVIKNNHARYPKDIHGVREKGEPIEIHGFVNQGQENGFVLEKVREYQKKGVALRDMAVLFRTNTAARPLVEKFMEYNIPFQMRDSLPNIYEHWIAQDLITYIHMAQGSRKRQDFLKIANRPKRYLSRDVLQDSEISFLSLRRAYEDKDWMLDRLDKLESDLTVISRLKPYAAVNYIRNGVGYEEYLSEYAEYRHIRVEELLEVLNELQEAAKGFDSFEDWFQHMEEYKETLKTQNREKNREEDAVTLTTLHSSKGLEFPVVFIVDINEGTIPHRKATLEADLEEERRMFYVGMTRAKDRLHLYYAKELYGKKQDVSRFLDELRAKPDAKS